MLSRNATIASAVGLHARPATIFSRKVKSSGIPVAVGRPGGASVDGASVLAVMMLGIRCGEEVVLTTDVPNSEKLLDELVALLEVDHGVAAIVSDPGHPMPTPLIPHLTTPS